MAIPRRRRLSTAAAVKLRISDDGCGDGGQRRGFEGDTAGRWVPYLTKLPPSFLCLGKNFHP
jgi:hypothetical protein